MSETQKISECFPLNPTTTSQLGHVWINSLKSSKHSETMQQGMQPAKKIQNPNYKHYKHTGSLHNAIFGTGKKSHYVNFLTFPACF